MKSRLPSLQHEQAKPSVSWLVRLGYVQGQDPWVTNWISGRIGATLQYWWLMALGLIPGLAMVFGEDAPANLSPMALFSGFLLAVVILNGSKGRLDRGSLIARVWGVSITAFVIGNTLSNAVFAEMGRGLSSFPTIVMLASGLVAVIAFSNLSGAMFAFVVGVFAAAIWASISWLQLAAIIPIGVTGIALVVASSLREYRNAMQHDQSASRAQSASRLLLEYEKSGPGWFWETDRLGNIDYVSTKLSLALGLGENGLIGKPLSILSSKAGEVVADTPAGQRTLSFYLNSRTAFTDLPITASIAGEPRWWSISGRPRIDEFGQFRGFVGSGSDLTEQRKSEAEVSRLARFDPLTGLANRAEMSKLLEDALSLRSGSARPCTLMLIDLDRFKSVNDTMGHPAGDALLKQVSQRLMRAVGSAGQVGRIGGDEFKVVLPGSHDRVQLAALSRTIIASASAPYRINGVQVTIGASIGIALAPDDGQTSEELIRNADLALYAAKEAGRGVHRFYMPGMHSAAEEKRALEEELRLALSRGQFHMAYQPIVAIKTQQIIGFESLIRWNHPERGPVSPGEFIPLAEETGLIEPIGDWILRQACADAARWPIKARVAVNISAIQFANPQLPTLIQQVLAQTGLNPDRLELEITESVFVAGDEVTDKQFKAIKSLGVRLALDDFGTGYSSLSYLQRAPFDKIKIDQSFVRGATDGDNRNSAIISAIVSLANTLKMETTVEGVETHDEIALVQRLGCSHIQGFVFGKPMNFEILMERMSGKSSAAEANGHQTSRKPRYRMLRTGETEMNNRRTPVRIRNISSGGAAIEPCANVAPGTRISLQISDGPLIEGEVRWVSRSRAGVKFDYPLDLSLLNTESLAKAS